MSSPLDHSRRRFLRHAAAATPVVLLGAGCAGNAAGDRELSFASLDQALQELDRLSQPGSLQTDGIWNWTQTLSHCAQSIEFSMSGFPQAKSPLFQHTVGAAAFRVFAWNGRMSHDLGEPIPGAPALDASLDSSAATLHLWQAIMAFKQWDRPLQPHFAYGELSKAEYEQAHAMHLANHFSAFRHQA